MATSEEMEDVREVLRLAARSLPPSDAVLDLLDIGVCARCIFRLFGVLGRAYSFPSITDAVLKSFLEEPDNFHSNSGEIGCRANGATFVQFSNSSKETRNVQPYCSICLGILQFAHQDQELMKTSTNRVPVDDFTLAIAELVKKENYHIDGFSIEVSMPPVIVANERAVGLYMKKKYESEEWFSAKFLREHLSVKDALRTSTTALLEKHLGDVSDSNSFRIRLTYSHPEASRRLQSSLANDLSGKGAKTVMKNNVNKANDSYEGILRNSEQQTCNESDAAILRALEGMQDHVFYECFTVPPDKTFKPCHLTTTCYRMPIYVGGRYLKFSRNVSQTCWMVDDERIGEASVEEIVGKNILSVCRGDNYKFHAAGREDIDVRMLGSGRPFLIEIANSRRIPSKVDIGLISEKINNNDQNHVRVRNLSLIGNEAWTLMREGEAEKQKQYAALVWISRSLTDGDMQNISSLKDLDIIQRTPIRVLHRRSPLERKRIIHWMSIEKVSSSSQYFLLHLCTQAGTYIKEFVHGDLGRTHPSVGSILGCRAEILQLDVTDVKMDIFN
ncbi:tRNA pseudouridine synthase Pus10-like isoform X1 [Zingiber officinale]|uniref:tRNA pseudouridine(55) synthase n=1 Tax=Zingiber officinale TaxID=94328 RepID=A0A8J5F474_ZINOF|nr:tRNA pseudouridine synthase Pus10-like isoform X1 [Zingiber officinale]KAG6477842.1 hypothetical protein ZIOFF_061274 [Zingiber officinale]